MVARPQGLADGQSSSEPGSVRLWSEPGDLSAARLDRPDLRFSNRALQDMSSQTAHGRSGLLLPLDFHGGRPGPQWIQTRLFWRQARTGCVPGAYQSRIANYLFLKEATVGTVASLPKLAHAHVGAHAHGSNDLGRYLGTYFVTLRDKLSKSKTCSLRKQYYHRYRAYHLLRYLEKWIKYQAFICTALRIDE